MTLKIQIKDENLKKVLEGKIDKYMDYNIGAIDKNGQKVEIQFDKNNFIITPIKIIETVNRLIFPYQNIKDLSGIEIFSNVVLLNIDGNKNIKNIDIISELKKIQYLSLNDLSLEEIPKFIYHLNDLKALYLNNNNIKTLALQAIPSLLFLHLQNNKIEFIDKTIKKFDNQLWELYLHGNPNIGQWNYNFDSTHFKHSIFGKKHKFIIISKGDRISKLKIQYI